MLAICDSLVMSQYQPKIHANKYISLALMQSMQRRHFIVM